MSENFTPVAQVGEFGLIDRLADTLGTIHPDDLIMGIGDDAAVYRVGENVQVVTTDALVEGVHFDRTFAPMEHIGYKALIVNISDIIAMNAAPRFATVVLGMPNNVSVEQAELLYAGIRRAAEQYGVVVIGGDITAAERTFLSITVMGEARESDIIYRNGAESTDFICVTGDLGSAAAGLKVLLAEKEVFQTKEAQPDLSSWKYIVERQLSPRARMDRLELWREHDFRPSSLIDISDGLASEVHHLCRASRTGANLDAAFLPMHVETIRAAERFGDQPFSYALFGGEDYELVFTASEAELSKLPEDSFAVVGQMNSFENDVTLTLPGEETIPLDPGGFRHF